MAVVLQADARALPLRDQSVDLIVTSPPFYRMRTYAAGGEPLAGQLGAEATPWEYLDNLLACTTEWARVLKPTGSIFVNLGDKFCDRAAWEDMAHRGSLLGLPARYALRVVSELRLVWRQELVWEKTNPIPDSVPNRAIRSHETWLHFTADLGYYADVDALRIPYADATEKRYAAGYNERALDSQRLSVNTKLGATKYEQNPLGRRPGSVWRIGPEPLRIPPELGVAHFAPFPTEWPRRLILGWCPPDGVVLDPCSGTGTTALVASVLGRRAIAVDLSADYCRASSWRVNDPSQRAKAGAQAPLF